MFHRDPSPTPEKGKETTTTTTHHPVQESNTTTTEDSEEQKHTHHTEKKSEKIAIEKEVNYEDLIAQREKEEKRLEKLNQALEAETTSSRKKASTLERGTINYAKSLPGAMDALNISADDLLTRKPHTKRGTGSSGTKHDEADADAANFAKKKVQDQIEKKTGVRMDPSDFVRQQEKQQAASMRNMEKQQEKAQKAYATIQRDSEDFKDYIALLAPTEWRKQQENRGNTVRSAPLKKRVRDLELKAKEQNWPKEWDSDFAQYLYE